ncbi:hypothetical protein TNIN_394441 [Trichonephila inaurata madagascariensis]|uniref:Uncharacterized protein n=1 Tax=Trichonephila inaurata madagascariensis TaxID=2747483 RepID=A0A8X6MJ07_9ARAC|nr:hypothetical protein TNIN_394441 [Trichonephila inaurata madagascariensis]
MGNFLRDDYTYPTKQLSAKNACSELKRKGVLEGAEATYVVQRRRTELCEEHKAFPREAESLLQIQWWLIPSSFPSKRNRGMKDLASSMAKLQESFIQSIVLDILYPSCFARLVYNGLGLHLAGISLPSECMRELNFQHVWQQLFIET